MLKTGLIPAASINEWTMMLSEDGNTFNYILKRDGELHFRADLDLRLYKKSSM